MAPPPGTAPARHLGIVAASPEGCSPFYREFFRRLEARAGGLPAPRVSLHNEPLGAYLGAVDRADWQTVGQLLAESAKKLVSIGADLLVVPENLLQFGVHLAEHAAPVPWLKTTDGAAEAVTADGRAAVGIIGTRLVMEGSTYQTMLGLKGIKVIAPLPEDAQMIDDVIFDELVHGIVNIASRNRWREAIDRLAQRGAQGVILAATEASLLITPSETILPVYDSLTLLADTCVKRCTGTT